MKLITLAAALFAATAASAATIYVGADGKFYDAASGGSEVSYTAGDVFNWQTGVTSWTISQDISGGGGLSSAGGKTIVMDSDYTASLGGGVTTGSSTRLTLNVSGGADLSFSSVSQASTYYNINTSGTSSAQSNVSITTTYASGSNYVNIAGIIGSYSTLKVSGASNTFVRVSGSLIVEDNSTLNFSRLQAITATSVLTMNAANTTITQLFVGYGATVTLNKTNAFTNASIFSAGPGASNIGYMILNANQAFKSFVVNTAGTYTLFDLNGHDMSFTGITNQANGYMYISDFIDGSVYFGATLATNEDGSVLNVFGVTGYDTSTAYALYQREDGYLYTTVPEPAEFAALFGALAIGFAVWRRRRA